MSKTPTKERKEITIISSEDEVDLKSKVVPPTSMRSVRLRSETRRNSPDEYKARTPVKEGGISRRELNQLGVPQLQRKRSKSSSLANDSSSSKTESRLRMGSPSYIKEIRAPITRSRSPLVYPNNLSNFSAKKTEETKKRKLSGVDGNFTRHLQKIKDNDGQISSK